MTTELAVRQKSEIQVYLEDRISDLARCCPKHLTPETMIMVATLIVSKTPDLQRCIPDTILSSVIEAGSLGLSINPKQGEAYLIPRRNKNNDNKWECNLQLGWRGLAKLVRGNGKVEYIVPHIVYAKDEFEVEYEPDTRVTHRMHKGDDRGPMTHVYSAIKFLSGSKIYDVMSKADVDKVRRTSQAADGPFWKNWYDEMAKKTIVRRHSKSVDQTPELARAIEIDNAEYESVAVSANGPARAKIENDPEYGKYASPEHQATYTTAIDGYREQRNQQWLDAHTNKETGEVPEKLAPHLATLVQCDDHLVEFAEACGMLAKGSRPEGGIKTAQVGRLASIPFCRSDKEQVQLKRELKAFLDRQQAIALEALKRDHPELFADEPKDDLADLADDVWPDGRE